MLTLGWPDSNIFSLVCFQLLRSAEDELPMTSEDLTNAILDAVLDNLPSPIKNKLLSCA